MATVCGGSLALMDAGVPTKSPVSGIAMGLVKEGDDYVILTDIAGFEDYFGDMDFKIAGTEKGITAAQLDIKIKGLSNEIIENTLGDAKKARLFILDKMKDAMSSTSGKLSEYAPVIKVFKIPSDKVRDLIGPGGKVVKELISTFNSKINVDDNGNVTVAAPNTEIGEKLIKRIKELTATAEIGKSYRGKITRIEDYGVFVEILHGVTGLVHISQISHKRIQNIRDEHFKIGQFMDVKVIGFKENKVQLSKKALEVKENSYNK